MSSPLSKPKLDAKDRRQTSSRRQSLIPKPDDQHPLHSTPKPEVLRMLLQFLGLNRGLTMSMRVTGLTRPKHQLRLSSSSNSR